MGGVTLNQGVTVDSTGSAQQPGTSTTTHGRHSFLRPIRRASTVGDAPEAGKPGARTSEEIDKEFEEMFATMSVAPSPSLTQPPYSLNPSRRLSVNSWMLENADANKAGVLPSSPVMKGLHGPVDVDWMPQTPTDRKAQVDDAQEKNGWAVFKMSRTTALPPQASSSSSGLRASSSRSGLGGLASVAAALVSPRRHAVEADSIEAMRGKEAETVEAVRFKEKCTHYLSMAGL